MYSLERLVFQGTGRCFKCFSALSREGRKRIQPANPGPGLIDAAPAILQKHAGIIRAGGVHHENREKALQHIRIGILGIKVLHKFQFAALPQKNQLSDRHAGWLFFWPGHRF